MRHSFALPAMLLLFGAFAVANAGEERPSTPARGVCPFGHANLRNVPIFYGLPAMSPELQDKIDRLEICIGGCVVGEETTRLICAQCRYAQTGPRERWSAAVQDPARLQRPPHPLLQTMRRAIGPALRVTWRQEVNPHGEVLATTLYCTVAGTREQWLHKIRMLAEQAQLQEIRLLPPDTPERQTLAASAPQAWNWQAEIRPDSDPTPSVSLILSVAKASPARR